jgi:AcrR family transcriptional regulator
MQPSIRALRRHLDLAGHPPLPLTQRQADTRARILNLAQCLMAEFGAKTIKFTALAQALRISPATLRFHFADHDDLLAALLARHLDHIEAALAEASARDRRAAYRTATRTPSGTLTEAHTLLLRHRRDLHPDERPAIDTARRRIATLLAGAPALPRTQAKAIRPEPPTLEQIIARTQQLRADIARLPPPPRPSKHRQLAMTVARMNPALFTSPQTPVRASG